MLLLRPLRWRRRQKPRPSLPLEDAPPHRSAADAAIEGAQKRLRLALLLLGAVLIYGTIGYALIVHLNTLDAFYMTVITVFTVGFSEVGELGESGRLFTITLIFSGTGVSLYALGAAAELFTSEHWTTWRQQHEMRREIEALKDHYIICGYGRIGRQVASDLRDSDTPFVVIDNDAERCQALLEAGVPRLEGDATHDETLLEAGIEHAKGVVAALNADADNVMAVVSARGLNPKLFIIARAALPEAEKKLLRAGADEVVSPYEVGARRISLSMLRPAVSGFLNAVIYDRQLQAEITEMIVQPDSPWAGQTLSEAGLAHGQDVLPLALLRDGKLMFSPLPDTVLHAHDTLIVVVPREGLSLERK